MTQFPAQTDGGTEVLVRHLADVARLLLAPGTVDQTLERIATAALATIEDCDEAGLCTALEGPKFSPATSPLVSELSSLQSALGEGPCIDALGGGDAVYADDLAAGDTWPRFAPVAVEAGIRSALAYRLSDGSRTVGALQLYARRPNAFTLADRAGGLLFASLAGMAVSVAEDHATQVGRSANLEAALVSREVIGQAQGILMERERMTAEQAFGQLRRASQHLNVKLRDVAQSLVDTGSLPPA